MDTEFGRASTLAADHGRGSGRGFRAPDDPDRPRGFRAAAADPVPAGAPVAPEDPVDPETPTGGSRPATGAGRHGPVRGRPWRWTAALAAVLVVAVGVVALLAFRLGARATPASTPAAAPTAPPTTASTLPVTDVYRQVAPSVVVVTTSTGHLGSGVVVTDTGTVLTANHVIAGGGTIGLVFADGTRSTATVGHADPATDTATLIPGTLPGTVVAATLGGTVAVGANVVAIGNPLALQDSTSAGVVSGLDRTATTDAGRLSGLIQFDAAVNPGSSGGPLLDDQGSVIGIVLSIADPGNDDAFAGIGFAAPIGAAVGGTNGRGPSGGPQK